MWGLAALFARELAAPYCLFAGCLALWRRRWPEARVWALGGALYALYYGLHAWQGTAAYPAGRPRAPEVVGGVRRTSLPGRNVENQRTAAAGAAIRRRDRRGRHRRRVVGSAPAAACPRDARHVQRDVPGGGPVVQWLLGIADRPDRSLRLAYSWGGLLALWEPARLTSDFVALDRAWFHARNTIECSGALLSMALETSRPPRSQSGKVETPRRSGV